MGPSPELLLLLIQHEVAPTLCLPSRFTKFEPSASIRWISKFPFPSLQKASTPGLHQSGLGTHPSRSHSTFTRRACPICKS